MKVVLLVCVVTIACGSFGQEVKSVTSEEIQKENEISEDKTFKDGSSQEKDSIRKLNSNNTLVVKLDDDFEVQIGTKLGRIVVPDLPEKDVDLKYQSQNMYEIKENITLPGLNSVNENDTLNANEILTTIANSEEETKASITLEPQSEESYTESLNNLKDIFETTVDHPTTVEPERIPPKAANKTLQVSQITVNRKNCTSKKLFPTLDLEVVKRVYMGGQDNQNEKMLAHETSFKKFGRRTFNSWNSLEMGEKKHGSIFKITQNEVPYTVPYPVKKEVPYPIKVEIDRPIPVEIPKPYPVNFEKNVFFPIREYIHAPYPVYRKIPYFIQISVDKPIPFHVKRLYPFYIEKKVPYPVQKTIAIPIKAPVDRPIPVHIPFVKNVYYPIEKKVRYPVPISMEKLVAVAVEKPYPIYIEKNFPNPVEERFSYPINVEDHKTKSDTRQNYNLKKEVEPFPNHKSEHIVNHESSEFDVNDGDFVHLSPTKNVYLSTFQKKKYSEQEKTKKEEILPEIMTTLQPQEKDTSQEERNINKTDHHDFGKKIKKVP